MVLATLLITASSLGIAQSQDEPTVIDSPNIKITRAGGLASGRVTGGSIGLKPGDVIEPTHPTIPARLAVSKTSWFALMPGSKMLILDPQTIDDPEFELLQGHVLYTSYPEIIAMQEPPPTPPPVTRPSMSSGRKRLLRAGQRTLGTEGTFFSAILENPKGDAKLSISVFDGIVTVFASGVNPIHRLQTGDVLTTSAK